MDNVQRPSDLSLSLTSKEQSIWKGIIIADLTMKMEWLFNIKNNQQLSSLAKFVGIIVFRFSSYWPLYILNLTKVMSVILDI